MAVYKRRYATYTGGLTPVWSRFWVLARYAFAEMFDSRIFTGMFVLSFVPTLITALMIWTLHSETLKAALQLQNSNPVGINNAFFLHWLEIQAWIAVFVTARVGPSMISTDLNNNALPLFLSRPLSRTEYVVGKMSVLLTLLSLLTWIPGLLLFALQVDLERGWFAQNYWIAPAIVLASLLWIAFLSLLSLALSAWVKWRIIATGALFAALMLPAAFGEVIDAVLKTYWGRVLNPWYMTQVVWYGLFRNLDFLPGQMLAGGRVPTVAAWISLLAVTSWCLLLLNRRLRAREVVRG
jgi:ABC-type transport system involved in multi-copper enzyme maturation permease subunit